MSASQATQGYESTFSIGTGVSSPYTYTPMAELKTIDFGGIKVAIIDVSNLSSPGGFREKITGFKDGNTITVSGNFIGDATQLAILTAIMDGVAVPWKITAPVQNGTKTYTVTGMGIVTDRKIGPMEIDKAIEFSCTVDLTGPPVESVA
jgi:predicted secreted protein